MVDAVNSCCCCCPSVIDEDSVDVNDEILKDLNFVLGEEMVILQLFYSGEKFELMNENYRFRTRHRLGDL